MLENKSFYDSASSFYDEMISFEDNLARMKNAFANYFTGKCNIADLGSGSGVDSIALAMNGHSVNGFDPSQKMVDLASSNAKLRSVEISFHKFSILAVPQKFNHKFDAVVSLGNTLANVEGDTIYSTIQRVYDLIKPGGQTLLHILNYQLILEKQERIVNIKSKGDYYFVRFYDFINGEVNFNILKFAKASPADNQLLTTRVFPYKKDMLIKLLAAVGFKEIKLMSNLEGEKFNAATSKDLFILATK